MDHVWRLTYPGVDFSFGDVALGVFHTTLPEVATFDTMVNDKRNPRRDGTRPGVDYIEGQLVSFSFGLAIAQGDREGAEGLRDHVLGVWRANTVRRVPGAVARLESPSGRFAFGRPREAAALDTMLDAGGVEVLAQFRVMSEAWYGELRTANVSFTVVPTTGFSFPVTFPLKMLGTGGGQAALEVHGNLPTPLEVIFHGPLTNPVADIGPLRLRLQGDILAGESVVVDGRRKQVTKNGLAVPGMIPPGSTRLSALVVDPGVHPVSLYGVSESGTGRIEVRAYDAHASY